MALPVVRSAFCKSGITELLRDCYGIKRPMQNAGAGRGQFRWVNGKAKLGFKLQKLPFKRVAFRDTFSEYPPVFCFPIFCDREKVCLCPPVWRERLIFVEKAFTEREQSPPVCLRKDLSNKNQLLSQNRR